MASTSFQTFMRKFEEVRPQVEAQSQTVEDVRSALAFFEGHYRLAEDVVVEAVDCNGVPAEWVSVAGSRTDRAILYIHGGCFISGSPVTVREFCSRLACAAGFRVLSVDYRLAPEHPFPAALDDVLTAYAWLVASGLKGEDIVIAGESAGGGLTFSALMQLRDTGELPMPALGVPISPWIDLSLGHKSLRTNVLRDVASTRPLHLGAEHYAAETDVRHPLISPLFGDLSGLPPLLIQVGGGEVLLDDALAIAHKARRQGVDVTLEVWPDMVHIWHWYASRIDEGAEAIAAIGAWIDRRMADLSRRPQQVA